MNDIQSHYGVVTDVKNGIASVAFQRSEMCSHCNICSSTGNNMMEITVKNSLNVKPGDKVTVSFETSKLLKASLICYVIPLVIFVAGLFIGYSISEIAAVIISLSTLLISFFVIRFINNKLSKTDRYTPVLKSVISE